MPKTINHRTAIALLIGLIVDVHTSFAQNYYFGWGR